MSGSEDKKVYIWDLQSKDIVQILEGHGDVVVAVAVGIHHLTQLYCVLTNLRLQTHPEHNMIASGSIDSDCTIRIWVDRGPVPV